MNNNLKQSIDEFFKKFAPLSIGLALSNPLIQAALGIPEKEKREQMNYLVGLAHVWQLPLDETKARVIAIETKYGHDLESTYRNTMAGVKFDV